MVDLRIWPLLLALLGSSLASGCARERPQVPHPRQIILISFDTLRADYLGAWRSAPSAWEATPNLDTFARESVVFKNTLTASTSTTRSHKSIFYGLYNHTHRTAMLRYPVEERVIGPVEVLRRNGLQTTAMACLGGMNSEVGVDRGFDEARWRRCMVRKGANDLSGLRKESFPWLADHAQHEFFLFLHTYQTHAPYYPDAEALQSVGVRYGLSADWPPPERVLNRWGRHWQRFTHSPRELGALRALYEAEVEMVDRWFGELVRHLRQLGIYESAIVIVLSDHGESLGENRFVGHSQMADEQTFVPLLMKVPGTLPRAVLDPVSLVDVMPTLFDLLELKPPYEFEGVSLAPVLRGRSRLETDRLRIVEHDTRVGLYRGPWKLHFDRSRPGTEILTRWTGGDVASQEFSEKERKRIMRDLLRMYAGTMKRSRPLAGEFVVDPNRPAELSDETLGELRALGYID